MNRAGRLWAMLRWGFTALGMWMILISCTPLTYWYATWLAGSWEDARGEVLIVLSASAGPHGMLAADSHHRAEYAVLAWRGGGFRKVVVCGKGAAGPIRDFLILSGVPADAVVLENESNSTRENALFAARVGGQRAGPVKRTPPSDAAAQCIRRLAMGARRTLTVPTTTITVTRWYDKT